MKVQNASVKYKAEGGILPPPDAPIWGPKPQKDDCLRELDVETGKNAPLCRGPLADDVTVTAISSHYILVDKAHDFADFPDSLRTAHPLSARTRTIHAISSAVKPMTTVYTNMGSSS
jgi:hypothetical protein